MGFIRKTLDIVLYLIHTFIEKSFVYAFMSSKVVFAKTVEFSPVIAGECAKFVRQTFILLLKFALDIASFCLKLVLSKVNLYSIFLGSWLFLLYAFQRLSDLLRKIRFSVESLFGKTLFY